MKKEIQLETKREFDIYIVALTDVKTTFNMSIDNQINRMKGAKNFCDKE